jgi:hypothetical protein
MKKRRSSAGRTLFFVAMAGIAGLMLVTMVYLSAARMAHRRVAHLQQAHLQQLEDMQHKIQLNQIHAEDSWSHDNSMHAPEIHMPASPTAPHWTSTPASPAAPASPPLALQLHGYDLASSEPAWNPEVDRLYEADLYSSVESAGRSLGRRLRRYVESLNDSARPGRIIVKTTAGAAARSADDVKQDLQATVFDPCAREVANELRKLDGCQVIIAPPGSAWDETNDDASVSHAEANAHAWHAAEAVHAEAVPYAEEAAHAGHGGTDVPAASGGEVAPASTTEPSNEQTSGQQDENEHESTVDGAETQGAETQGAEIGSSAETEANAETRASSEVEASAEVASDLEMLGTAADGGGAAGSAVLAAESDSSSGTAHASQRPEFVVQLRLDSFNRESQDAPAWVYEGVVTAVLNRPGESFWESVRFDTKPWVESEDVFRSQRPNENLFVARSGFAMSADEADDQTYEQLARYLHDWMARFGSIDPSVVHVGRFKDTRLLDPLIRDRFVQRLDGPGGQSLWREAVLVDTSPAKMSNVMSTTAEWQHVQMQQVHQRRWEKRAFGAQIAIAMVGIFVIYGMLNALTKGYFAGRLRLIAVLTALLAVVGLVMAA